MKLKKQLYAMEKTICRFTLAKVVIGAIIGFILISIMGACIPEGLPVVVPTLPVVSTTDVKSTTNTSVTLGGNILSDGNDVVKERGICWSLSSNPTVTDNKISVGVGSGYFDATVEGLKAGTTYSFRAYAINGVGISYGSNVSALTNPSMYNVTITTGANGSASISGAKQFAAQSALKVDLIPAIGYMVDAVKINGISYPLTVNTFNYIVDKDNATLEFSFKFDVLWTLLEKPWIETLYQQRNSLSGPWTDYHVPEFKVEKHVFHQDGTVTSYLDGNQQADRKYLLRNDSLFLGVYPGGYGNSYKIIQITRDVLVVKQSASDASGDSEVQKTFKH